jgi:hypothetical protein
MDKANNGEITYEQAVALEPQLHAALANEQWQPQAEAQQIEQPQPEASEPPPSGVSEKVARALQDPEIREAISQPLQQAEQARQQYAHATDQLMSLTAAATLAQFPELQGFAASELPAVVRMLAQQNPQRAQELLAFATRTDAIVTAHNEAKAQAAQRQQAQFQSWARQQDAAFSKSLGAEATPEKVAAVQREIFSYARENGIDQQELMQLYASNPVMRSAPFQRMMFEAAQYRIAKRTAAAFPASRGQLPQVQKPGIPRTRADDAQAEIGGLRADLRKSKGTDALRAAVRLHQAQRRARS